MSSITAENVLTLIEQLPVAEQQKLRQLWVPPGAPAAPANGHAHQPTHKAPLDKRLPPQPMPDGTGEMRWLAEHQRAYAGQWVALDGERLIAAGPNHAEVWAAAQADGTYLPLITLVEDPDNIIHIIWK